jgi:hypothetical protein
MAELRSTGYKNARAAAVKTIFDYGVIRLYSGSRPASADLAETGTLLAEITNDGGAFTPGVQDGAGLRFDGPVNGALSIKAGQNWKTNAILATGTIGYGVLYDNGRVLGADPNSVRTYFTVGMSGADMNLSRTSVTAGEPFTLTGATLTVQ